MLDILAPDGRHLCHLRQIPDLPAPSLVVVRGNYVCIDCWFIQIYPLLNPFLWWFSEQSNRWLKMDSSPENRAQIIGMIDAMENLVKAIGTARGWK